MKLIVISSERPIEREAYLINKLFSLGMDSFHLRKPGSNIEQVGSLIDLIDPAFYSRIALHQHHELAPLYGITRLHFTEQARNKMPATSPIVTKGKKITLSTSVHDIHIISTLSGYAYTFLSAVFDSLSKPGYQSTINIDYRIEKKVGNPKVIALGGVEVSRLKTLNNMGFDGAAVLGAIWNQPQIALQTFNQLQAGIKNLRNHHHDQ